MNKRKILALAMALSMVAILAVGATLAYFTDTKSATNTFTVGQIDVELYESKYHRGATGSSYLKMDGQPEPLTDEHIIADNQVYQSYLAEQKILPFNYADYKNANPESQDMFEANTIAKNAYVKNTGANDMFVRVRYIVPAEVAEYLDVFYVDTQFIKEDNEIATGYAYKLEETTPVCPIITKVDSSKANLAAGWDKNEDGDYEMEFTYAKILKPGEMTKYSPISKVYMLSSVTSDKVAELSQFDIEVEVDAIQADGFKNAVQAFAAFDTQENN